MSTFLKTAIRAPTLFVTLFLCSIAFAESPTASTSPSPTTSLSQKKTAEQSCNESLKKLKGAGRVADIESLCKKAKQLDGCTTVDGLPIFHFESQGLGEGKKPPRRVLSISLIHGDEEESAAVTLAWLERLQKIDPRNSWRVIPIMNPDGWNRKTRTNAHGIDVNRNFPSQDWNKSALKYWKEDTKENPRRFPGEQAASEPETKCAIAHINDFKPDFIISIHTPLGVLDFDGPKVSAPRFAPLPWVSLGNYPGSLGRYMWLDRQVPVLTVELKADGLKHLEEFDRLQDITGTVAIQAEKLLKKNKKEE